MTFDRAHNPIIAQPLCVLCCSSFIMNLRRCAASANMVYAQTVSENVGAAIGSLDPLAVALVLLAQAIFGPVTYRKVPQQDVRSIQARHTSVPTVSSVEV